MATQNPTATDLSCASNVADIITAKNVKRAKTHQQLAHHAEAITPQTTGDARTTTTYLKDPIHTGTSHNAHNQHIPIQTTTTYNLVTTYSKQEATQM